MNNGEITNSESADIGSVVRDIYRLCGSEGREEFLRLQPRLGNASSVIAYVGGVLPRLEEQDRRTLMGILCEAEQACMLRTYVTSDDGDIFASKEEWDGVIEEETVYTEPEPPEPIDFERGSMPDYKSAEKYFTFIVRQLDYIPYNFIRSHESLVDELLEASRVVFVRKLLKAAKRYLNKLPRYFQSRERLWVISLEQKTPTLISDCIMLFGAVCIAAGSIGYIFDGGTIGMAIFVAVICAVGIFYFSREYRKAEYRYQRLLNKLQMGVLAVAALSVVIGMIVNLF